MKFLVDKEPERPSPSQTPAIWPYWELCGVHVFILNVEVLFKQLSSGHYSYSLLSHSIDFQFYTSCVLMLCLHNLSL